MDLAALLVSQGVFPGQINLQCKCSRVQIHSPTRTHCWRGSNLLKAAEEDDWRGSQTLSGVLAATIYIFQSQTGLCVCVCVCVCVF